MPATRAGALARCAAGARHAQRDARGARAGLRAHRPRQGPHRARRRPARHALKNALLPIITVIGLQFGGLLGGAVMTETVFAWPGVGHADPRRDPEEGLSRSCWPAWSSWRSASSCQPACSTCSTAALDPAPRSLTDGRQRDADDGRRCRRASAAARPRLRRGGAGRRGPAPWARRRWRPDLVILVVAAGGAALAPWLAPHGYDDQDLAAMLQPPVWVGRHLEQSARHRPARPRRAEPPRSTARRTSLVLALGAVVLIAAAFGVLLGLVSGWAGGRGGRGDHALAEVQLSLPVPALRHRVHGAPGPSAREPRHRARAAELGRLRAAGPRLGAVA